MTSEPPTSFNTVPQQRMRRWREGGLPQTAAQRVVSVLVLMFFAGSVGYWLGQPRPPGEESVDVGFLKDMILHHEQAVEMASRVVNEGSEPVVRNFAKEVLIFQQYEIGLMEAFLRRWGHLRPTEQRTAMGWMGTPVPVDEMAGMASEAQMQALADAGGRDVDRLFVSMMIEHHRGAIDMGSVAARDAVDSDVRALATRIVRNQRVEIAELRSAQRRLGLAP